MVKPTWLFHGCLLMWLWIALFDAFCIYICTALFISTWKVLQEYLLVHCMELKQEYMLSITSTSMQMKQYSNTTRHCAYLPDWLAWN